MTDSLFHLFHLSIDLFLIPNNVYLSCDELGYLDLFIAFASQSRFILAREYGIDKIETAGLLDAEQCASVRSALSGPQGVLFLWRYRFSPSQKINKMLL